MSFLKNGSYFFLTISGLLYAAAFLFSDYCWWFILLFPFFFLMSSEKNISFFDAFLWGFIAYGLHIIGIVYALYLMHASWLFLLFLFFYVPMLTAIPFYFRGKLNSFIKKRWQLADYFTTFSNGFSLFLSQIILTEMILLPCGRVEGYILAHPFTLCAGHILKQLLVYNFDFLTLFFYLFFIFLVIFLKERNIRSFVPFFIVSLLFVAPLFLKQETQTPPPWIKQIGVLPLFFPNPHNLNTIFDFIEKKITKNLNNNPEISLVLLPEGAIDCAINKNHIEDIIKNYDIFSNINMIFGASCWQKNYLNNSCFILKKGKIEKIYHKRHAMPLTEKSIIFSSKQQKIITPSDNPHPLLSFEDFSLVPYICSELFLNRFADDHYQNFPIVVFCSDIWFFGIGSYIKELMIKTTQLKAILWNRPIIYISYSDSYFIEKNGEKVKLQSLI